MVEVRSSPAVTKLEPVSLSVKFCASAVDGGISELEPILQGKISDSMEPVIQTKADPAGLETLELFSKTVEFNRWMFDRISPYCGGSILEIGSGIGNISTFLLENFTDVVLSDLRPEYCHRLESAFNDKASLKGVFSVDLALERFEERYRPLIGQFDTVIALNVVEHIDDEALAIRNAHALLKPGGRMVILVPVYPWLYNSLDRELGHFRRYTKKSLEGLLTSQQLRVLYSEHFNTAAIGGWWVTGSLLQMDKIKEGPLNVYNRLVPLMRLIDRLSGRRIGLSIITVATAR